MSKVFIVTTNSDSWDGGIRAFGVYKSLEAAKKSIGDYTKEQFDKYLNCCYEEALQWDDELGEYVDEDGNILTNEDESMITKLASRVILETELHDN